tara:strand:- start:244 stop:483 length:240 start_codon:yes stop_codon:yes gene_type:complete
MTLDNISLGKILIPHFLANSSIIFPNNLIIAPKERGFPFPHISTGERKGQKQAFVGLFFNGVPIRSIDIWGGMRYITGT